MFNTLMIAITLTRGTMMTTDKQAHASSTNALLQVSTITTITTITIIIVYVRDSIVMGRIGRPMFVFSFLKVKLALTLSHSQ